MVNQLRKLYRLLRVCCTTCGYPLNDWDSAVYKVCSTCAGRMDDRLTRLIKVGELFPLTEGGK